MITDYVKRGWWGDPDGDARPQYVLTFLHCIRGRRFAGEENVLLASRLGARMDGTAYTLTDVCVKMRGEP